MSELTSEERTAIGHAAYSLGASLTRSAKHWVKVGAGREEAAWLKVRLDDYRTLCDVAAIPPVSSWVETIEAAIASAEIDS